METLTIQVPKIVWSYCRSGFGTICRTPAAINLQHRWRISTAFGSVILYLGYDLSAIWCLCRNMIQNWFLMEKYWGNVISHHTVEDCTESISIDDQYVSSNRVEMIQTSPIRLTHDLPHRLTTNMFIFSENVHLRSPTKSGDNVIP